MRRLILILGGFILAACDARTEPDAAPSSSQSLGGIWRGTDDRGNDIVAIVSETGEFHFLDTTNDAQGFGTGNVANGNAVALSYTFVPEIADTLFDGSTSGTCTGTGTVQQRASLSVSVNCTTSASAWTSTATLTYDALYDRDSSLALLAGNYQNGGDVLTISSGGVLFLQSATTGCVFNGQVGVIDSSWNAYSVVFTISNCTGVSAAYNGSSWGGIATLELFAGTEAFIAAFTGTVQGMTVSMIVDAPEI